MAQTTNLQSPEWVVTVCVLPHKEPCSLGSVTQHVLGRQALSLRDVANLEIQNNQAVLF